MSYYLLLALGLIFQLGAISLLLQEKLFVIALLIHLVGSAWVSLGVYCRRHYFDRFNLSMVLLFFILTLVIPVVGIIGVFILVNWLKKSQVLYAQPKIFSVMLNDDVDLQKGRYGVGGIRVRLQSLHFEIEERVEALSRLIGLRPAVANPLVREVLPDNREEIRMFAFRILEKQERFLTSGIQAALLRLEQTTELDLRADIHKWLALQYWEFIYTKLIDPVLEKRILEKVLFHSDEARKHLVEDAPLIFFSGRVYLWAGNAQMAQQLFEKCLMLGTSPNRVSPYLAENYFNLKEYQKIKTMFGELPALKYIPISRDLYYFWMNEHE